MVIFPQDGLVHALVHRSGAVEAEHHGRPLEGAAHPVRGSILLLVGALGVAAALPRLRNVGLQELALHKEQEEEELCHTLLQCERLGDLTLCFIYMQCMFESGQTTMNTSESGQTWTFWSHS